MHHQFKSLLEGLGVPDAGFWMIQSPSALKSLGENISYQARIAGSLQKIIKDDSFAVSFQTMRQYRNELLRQFSLNKTEEVKL